MRRNYNNNYIRPSAEDRLQWKIERENQIGQLIITNTLDTILQNGLVISHINGSCYKVLANGEFHFASHHKASNTWKLWSDK